MSIRTKFTIRALFGFSLGLIAGAIMFVLYASDTEPLNKSYLIMQLFGSGFFGVIANGGAIVYDFEDWGLLRATFTHYVVTFITMLAVSELLDWFPRSIILIVVIFFSAVYLIIWLVEYALWKKEIRHINRDLEIMKNVKD
ncbi:MULTISPECIES: DUF3021 domain-containing protein [unclassified Butyrivibrio]|uniref:DUF3021 domain-containing protein n=1 Tax=unclassified Butyrivibrio TaxID=2639466 RepID=UPI000406ADDF|nr:MULTISPECIES: DUF3021 domain-containing protein [unclassified Butyrivibrio]